MKKILLIAALFAAFYLIFSPYQNCVRRIADGDWLAFVKGHDATVVCTKNTSW